ncbi:MAG: TetR/AcrR family transcriptional regulator, partial [Comamonadaceae bacterium]
TSTRMVASAARVNLGGLHYHFESKEALYLEVFRRRGVPLVAERLRLLDEAQARAGDAPVPVRELLRCFVRPFLETSMRLAPPAFTQLHCRLAAEPEALAMQVRGSIYNASTRTFAQAFARTLSHLPRDVLDWRLHFVIGAYNYTLMRSGRLEFISEGRCESTDLDAALRQILPFLEAGLTAPLP